MEDVHATFHGTCFPLGLLLLLKFEPVCVVAQLLDAVVILQVLSRTASGWLGPQSPQQGAPLMEFCSVTACCLEVTRLMMAWI